MIAISAVIFLSKQKFIPITIFSYYAMYCLIQYSTLGLVVDSFVPITISPSRAATHYIMSASIELLVIVAICFGVKGHKKTGATYALFVLTSMVYNSIQAVSMSIESNWFVNFYTIRQQIAIPLDIIFAIIGSDNFVSRKFYITLNNSGDGNDADNRNNPD